MRHLYLALLVWLCFGAVSYAQDTQPNWTLDPHSIRTSDYQNLPLDQSSAVTLHLEQDFSFDKNHLLITPFISYTDIQHGSGNWSSVNPGARFSFGNLSITATATSNFFLSRGTFGRKQDGYDIAEFALPYDGFLLRASQKYNAYLLGVAKKF